MLWVFFWNEGNCLDGLIENIKKTIHRKYFRYQVGKYMVHSVVRDVWLFEDHELIFTSLNRLYRTSAPAGPLCIICPPCCKGGWMRSMWEMVINLNDIWERATYLVHWHKAGFTGTFLDKTWDRSCWMTRSPNAFGGQKFGFYSGILSGLADPEPLRRSLRPITYSSRANLVRKVSSHLYLRPDTYLGFVPHIAKQSACG